MLSSTTPDAPRRWRARWIHWIDSRTDEPAAVSDEADVEETSVTESVESGRMLHPDTGLMQDYEEIWHDRPVPAHAYPCVVFVADHNGHRGMLVRVGLWCQAIVRCGPDVCCERWMSMEQGMAWHCVLRVGEDLDLPCRRVCASACWAEGDEIEVGGLLWKCVESAA